jgi:hypothetical protein
VSYVKKLCGGHDDEAMAVGSLAFFQAIYGIDHSKTNSVTYPTKHWIKYKVFEYLRSTDTNTDTLPSEKLLGTDNHIKQPNNTNSELTDLLREALLDGVITNADLMAISLKLGVYFLPINPGSVIFGKKEDAITVDDPKSFFNDFTSSTYVSDGKKAGISRGICNRSYKEAVAKLQAYASSDSV